jgi:Putative DNA-binding domain
MNSHLQRLFASLSSEAELEDLIHQKREEDLHLEFKQKADRRNGDLSDKERQAFSKAISGFANADGGVLIFGVETSRGSDGVDRAISLKPIEGHDRFRAKLMDSILNATQPVADDIQIECIDGSDNAGYVKCLIPSSAKPPHRATLAEHHYWKRISTGHRRMEHYELEDVFGRRLRPKLKLFIEQTPRVGSEQYVDVALYLLNEGRGIARHVGFLCRFEEDCTILDCVGSGLINISSLNAGAPTVTYANDASVIHANGIFLSAGKVTLARKKTDSQLFVSVSWYAQDTETRRGEGFIATGARHMFL